MERPVVSPERARRRRRLAVAAVLAVLVLILIGSAATLWTDLLWYQAEGFDTVFLREIQAKVFLGLAFGGVFTLVLLANLWVARRLTTPRQLMSVSDQVLERYRTTLQPYIKWVVVGGAVLLGLFAGTGATAQWQTWLLFRNAVEVGQTDPQFGRDIGFFLFQLPFYRFLFTWLFSSLILVTLAVAAAHYLLGGIRTQGRDRVTPPVRAHLSVLFAGLVLLKAWSYRLDQYELLFSGRGTVTGASYTDVNAQLPALQLLVIIALLVGLLFLVNAWLRAWVVPAAGIGLLALTSILAGGAYPAMVQRFQVDPEERTREQPYIARNIEATRGAFGINIRVEPFPAFANVGTEMIERNRPVVENIRLWTPDVLSDVYLQLQRIRPYYDFFDVDVDRYSFGGERRQVMISPREMAQSGLRDEARTWLNNHLVYTHGFGVVASRVDRVRDEGVPDFIVQDIPPRQVAEELHLDEPRIYFGETEEVPFVVVNTDIPELDFPEGDSFREYIYDGDGGVEIGGMIRRAAFAWRFRDVNLILSGHIQRDSRIMFLRNIRDRIRRVAPFLQLDRDPYIAIVDGRLVWIADGYTTSDMYPYSERIPLGVPTEGWLQGTANYLRNSVKVVVNAFDGDVTLYAWEEDPILEAWAGAFPGIITPRSEVPPSIEAHFRYPEGLFRVQSDLYAVYHMTESDSFYAKEDAWQVPVDPSRRAQDRPMAPLYLMMKIPGEEEVEFVLFRPYTPRGRQNMIGFLVARSDPGHHGELVSYVFPTDRVIPGPGQVQARINQDARVSQQLTLWDQQQSEVIRGHLLVVPIEDSLIYVQPLYLRGEGARMPELRRVIAVSGETVRMGEDLDRSLAALFGDQPPAPIEGDGVSPPPDGEVPSAIREAILHFEAAQEALRRGDWGEFGRRLEMLREALDRAEAEAGPPPEPQPEPEPEPEPETASASASASA